ncbi:1-acyl-sn-glycerol-3-phosphate acyltransferase [Bacillus sp. ISL-47]|uniref:lysophospholipid acyltransferase family protein n=1 Tax=Bacillus sp. ISL-47 TaxID=2819130 RepID=UPI001BEC8199|nr:lysophospholipid acyltransferase family protein [Bacillus sp. ISL-47]MBT2690268.1 1-acyl-sn-glycerol-3-phosphate acyltransferase [Bacillus sp. ISL-47]MBT2708968.1 1-acyl-sn-glycerol-3-phosphate acyltransferase [Pseudomonas sp. ISL-84]
MLRLIIFFLYMGGYLTYSLPALYRMKKLDPSLSAEERDRIIHNVPQRWSRTVMKISGSKVNVSGQGYIPEGPVVMVCNHEGDFDIPALLASIDKPFGFISKVEVKKAPIISSWMKVMNCVFIDRTNRESAIKSLREGAELLKQGHSLVIFPEGTRSKGGPVAPFKVGGFRLAQDAGVPIVPISIKGTADVFEKNGRLIKPARIDIRVCPPVNPKTVKEMDAKVLAHEVREIICSSSSEKRIAS